MAEGRRLRPALARRDRDAALQDHHRPNAPRPDSARTEGRGQGWLQGAQPHDRSRHARLSKARLKPPGAPPLPPDLRLCTNAISVGTLANWRRTLATLDEMACSGPWMLFSGMVATAAGLAVVLGQASTSFGAQDRE